MSDISDEPGDDDDRVGSPQYAGHSNADDSTAPQEPVDGEQDGGDHPATEITPSTEIPIDAKKAGMRLQNKWEDMFKRLLLYRDKHGDCLVPNRYSEDAQLGSWVSTQRRHYKILNSGSGDSTPMTVERARRLEEAGFKWSTKDPRHVPWEKRFRELADFQKRYGHCQVPIGWEENVQLSNWVSTQRQEYKLIQRGRQSRLTTDRIKLLNEINFVWEAQRGGPRRKRKATVSVPTKANPVEATRPRTAKSTRGASGGAAQRGGMAARVESGAQVAAPTPVQMTQGYPINVTQVVPHMPLTGMPAILQTGAIPATTGQWQLLPNGAFQQPMQPVAVAGMGPSMFPIAAQWPMATASGFQFGMMPAVPAVPAVWTNMRPQPGQGTFVKEEEPPKANGNNGIVDHAGNGGQNMPFKSNGGCADDELFEEE